MVHILDTRDLVCAQIQFLQLVQLSQTLDLMHTVERHIQDSINTGRVLLVT